MKYRRKIIFSYDNNSLIEFLPYFKISKCPDNFPSPPFEHGHHPYFLDFLTEEANPVQAIMGYDYKMEDGPDFSAQVKSNVPLYLIQAYIDSDTMDKILFLHNAIGEHYFFYYGLHQIQKSWTISLGREHKLSYSQEGYFPPKDFDYNIQSIEKTENYEFLDSKVLHFKEGDDLHSYITLSNLLEQYYKSDKLELKQEYLNACIVLTKAFGLMAFDRSASYVFFVSAIESLISIENKNTKVETCNCCGQPKYKVNQKFKDFLDKYGYEIDNKTKNKFYSMRSNISHNGNLLYSSYKKDKMYIENQKEFEENHNDMLENFTVHAFRDLTKTCFRTFLLENIN